MNFRAVLIFVLAASSLPVFSQNQPDPNASLKTGSSQKQASSHPNDPGRLLGSDNAITTGVPFLGISPDARHAALGDAGVATTPDANAAYWNPAKLVFIDKKYGGGISYTPWLGKIVNDMSISYLSGFYKIAQEQVVAVGIKYFDLGDISFRDDNNVPQGDFNPRDFAFDATYSRMLSRQLSVGLAARYIYSNLTGALATIDSKPGNSVAADLGIYYTKDLAQTARNSTLSLGATITNIGAKISYTDEANRNFLPVNLRIGSAYKTELDPHNTITFALDFNKLMVPTPPIRDVDGNIVYGKDPNRTLLSGMFGSFSDAPDGGSEEIKEIMTSAGIEYWYDNTFAARLGYFNEAKTKGNRKYLTLGVGFRKDKFGIDVAYLVPTNKREHPLAETIRFSLLFEIPDGERTESVTDQ